MSYLSHFPAPKKTGRAARASARKRMIMGMIMKYTYTIPLLLLLFAAPVQAAERWEYFVPGNDIHDMAFQGDYTWCVTNYSIVRWDRRDMSYVQYTPRDYGTNRRFSRIAPDNRGNLWLTGPVRYDASSWTGPGEKDVPSSLKGYNPCGTGNSGDIWFTGTGNLARFDGSSVTVFSAGDSLPKSE